MKRNGPPPLPWHAPDLLAGLAGDDAEMRAGAIASLREFQWKLGNLTRAAKGIEALVVALRPGDREAVSAVGWMIRKVRDPKATPFLVELLSRPEPDLSIPAREALDAMGWEPKDDAMRVRRLLCGSDYGPLVRMGVAAVPHLLEALKTAPDRPRRAFAATALGKIGHASAFEGLVAATRDEESHVRMSAFFALGELGDPRALPFLRERALDPACEERGQAAAALRKLGKPGVPALVEFLRSMKPPGRWQTARDLGELGDPGAGDALFEQLAENQPLLRQEAALALGKLADPRALPALIEFARDGWYGYEAVDLMERVLKESAPRVPEADLRVAAALDGIRQTVCGDEEGYGTPPIVGEDPVNCAEVRRLAAEELARRKKP